MAGPMGGAPEEGGVQGLLSMLAPDPNLPSQPENPDVLNQIASARAWHDANVNLPGTGEGPYRGNEYFEAAAQPGMSGYFDYNPSMGGIVPRMMDPRQVAQDAGVSLGQLAGGMYPGGGESGYNIPNDRGGFFSLEKLFGMRQGASGLPIGGAAQMGSLAPSTNNWRLLGKGPGWIMRNGQYIQTQDPSAKWGLPLGADYSFSDTAESGAPSAHRYVSPGGAFGGMNKWDAYYWPGGSIMGYTRGPHGTNV